MDQSDDSQEMQTEVKVEQEHDVEDTGKSEGLESIIKEGGDGDQGLQQSEFDLDALQMAGFVTPSDDVPATKQEGLVGKGACKKLQVYFV